MASFRLKIMAQVLPFLMVAPGLALAQAPPTRAAAAAAVGQPGNPAAAQYTRQQIDQMIAPIALYPDQLLSQVLMAATYPTQITAAAEWLHQPGNAELKGDALVAALQPMPWEPSVKALVAFPQILVMLSEHIEWTGALGVAFATQQAEVMTRVQSLRHLAVKSGHLRQIRQLVVREEGPAIVIAPAQPDRIFVPVYNPVVVYGAWPAPAFPPVFIPPPPSFVAETIAPGIQVSVGFGVVAPLWGWSQPDWRARQITINQVQYTRITNNVQINNGGTWQHSGPVVLAAAPAAARAPAVASVPAGTVAPTKAAAVVSLPQKAKSQPNLIKTEAANQPAANQPAANQPGRTQATTGTTTAPAQPGQTTTAGKPAPEKPGTAQMTPGQPSATQTGQAKEGAAKPSTAQTAPTREQPGKPSAAQTTPTQEGAAKPSTAQTGTTQPEHPTATATESAKGKAHGKTPAPAANQANEHPSAAGKPAERATGSNRDEAGVKAQPGARERTQEHTGSGAAMPPPATRHAPEQAGAAPTGAAHQRATPEAARTGSSVPPAAVEPRAGQAPAATSSERRHEPTAGAAHQAGRPQDNDKNDK